MTVGANSRTSVRIDTPIFLSGVGRSGTSLLHSMLNAHPLISFTPETHFLRRYVTSGSIRRKLESDGPEAFRTRLELDDDFARAGVLASCLLGPFLDKTTPFDLKSVYDRFLTLYAEQEQKQFVGEKDPKFIEQISELHDLYPHAKIIHIVRDPRDVLLSRMKARWSAGRPWWTHPLIYDAQFHRGRQFGKRLFGENYIEVRYEDLITRPGSVLEGVCGLIGISFESCMLDFSQSATKLVAENELSWKRETLGGLLSNNMDKWRQELSAFQIRWTERMCGEALHDFDYAPASSEIVPGLAGRCALQLSPLCQALNRLCYPILLGLRG